MNSGSAPSEGGTGAPLGDVTPETDATPALDSAAPDSRPVASRKREPCSLLAGAPSEGGTGTPLGGVTPETDATPALDGAAPDSRTCASRKREPCLLLAGGPLASRAALSATVARGVISRRPSQNQRIACG